MSVTLANWWRQRHQEKPPETTGEALRRVAELRTPNRIRVWTNKKNFLKFYLTNIER